jgi:predicted transposase/invertase (TIGR01784 family)
MRPGIDPKVDYAFKWLFGSERNSHLLIDLINAVLDPPPGREVVAVEFLNPFHDLEAEDEKQTILDVKARDQSGRLFNVEMQMLAHRFLPQRILYYWARLYASQLVEGEQYNRLQPTVSICFLNAVLIRDTPVTHLTFGLHDSSQSVTLVPDLEIHLFELPKFDAPAEDVEGIMQGWLYFLRHAATLDTESLPEELCMSPIEQAMHELQKLAQDPEERERYENRLKFLRDQEAIRMTVREEGRQEGRIGFARSVLGLPPLTEEELQALSLDEAARMADELEQQVRAKFPKD